MRVAPTLAAPAPPEASPSDGGVEMEAPAPSPRFADAQAVDDERFVGDGGCKAAAVAQNSAETSMRNISGARFAVLS